MVKGINAQLPLSYEAALNEIRTAYPWYKDVSNNAIIKKAVEDYAEKARATIKNSVDGFYEFLTPNLSYMEALVN